MLWINEYITRTDLDMFHASLRQELASKQDLNSLEARLRRDLASKEDLNSLRKDFEQFGIKVVLEFAKVNARMDKMGEELHGEIRQLRGVVDKFIGDMQTYARRLGALESSCPH